MKKQRNTPRRYEAVDPRPRSLPLNFARPPTLQEQVASIMAASGRYAAAMAGDGTDDDDFGGPDGDWEDEAQSPHELVYDEDLNREITRYQKAHLDAQRAAYMEKIMELRAEKRKERAAIAAAARELAAKQQLKKTEESSEE